MAGKGKTVTQEIEINVRKHRETGLLLATSDQLKGLLVPARSERELDEKLPAAIKELVEAHGEKLVSVEITRQDGDLGAFSPPAFIARTQVAA